jgi:hypothetical protein
MLKFLPLGVPSFTPFLAMKYFFVSLGRAVRYNLCCALLHRGFPLPSLTQNQLVFMTIAIFFIAIAISVCISTLSPSPLERAGKRTKKTFNIKLKVVINF